jgi:UDP-N-acetylglucosamine 2-epimerase
MTAPLRILALFGTRPEAIKLAPAIEALRRAAGCQVITCATAQHREMLDQALALLDITCDYDLDLMRPNQTLPELTSQLLVAAAGLLDKVRPDVVLVQGDTTTAMASAMAAFYGRIPVAHLEAGLRSDDLWAPWPEEMNRRAITMLSSIHLAPTAQARDRLIAEGVDPGAIALTGNTVIDALLLTVDRLDRNPAMAAALDREFAFLDRTRRLILVTSHRRESFGGGLENICRALRRLADRGDVQIAFPVHLNANVRVPVHRALGGHDAIHLLEPLDYLQFVHLLRRAHCALTDSGGVQEEAPTLGVPVLVLRDRTERPEGIAAGAARLVGTDAGAIVAETERLLDNPGAHAAMARAVNPYGDGRASDRVAAFLVDWWQRRQAAAAGVSA